MVVYSEKLSASAETMKEKEQSAQGEAQESPGLLLRHYSPSVPSALLAKDVLDMHEGQTLPHQINCSILIDFGQQMRQHHRHFRHCFDLCTCSGSPDISVDEACARAFAVLREAEAFAELNEVGFICI